MLLSPSALSDAAPGHAETSNHQHAIAGQSSLVSTATKNEDLLIVSPYLEEEHLLDLKTVDAANKLLANALVGLKCLRDDYAIAPYIEIFNVSNYSRRLVKGKTDPLILKYLSTGARQSHVPSSTDLGTNTLQWAEVIDSVRKLAAASNFTWEEQRFYIVVFRSRIPPTTAYADLGVLDKAAHAEATKSGGFLK
jgi:hypothetical protein